MFRNVVDIKVGSSIRQWVMSLNDGSDMIHLDKRTNLWAIVKQNLELVPADYRIINDRSEYISIELLVTRGSNPVYNIPSQKDIRLNELYRCYISQEGQNAIKRYLENQLRNAFVIYMVARSAQVESSEKISHAITSFLLDYDLPVERKMVARLMKYWYRYRQKHPEKNAIPIFF